MSMEMLWDDDAPGLGLDLDEIIGRGFDFGKQFLNAWESRGVARAGINPYPTGGAAVAPSANLNATLLQQQQAALLAAQNQGLDTGDGHINIFGTRISYGAALAIGGIFVLLQMQPLRRK